jgi:uncharacterized damage-inducible protein DinB
MSELERHTQIELDILEAWRVHNDVNLYLLNHISDAGFSAVTLLKNGQPSSGRNVRRVFAHMLEVRVGKIPKAFSKGLSTLEGEESPSRDLLIAAFKASSDAFERLLPLALARDPSVKNPKRTGMLLFSYLIAHESHHRGQIMLALKQSGTLMREERPYGMWSMWFDLAKADH